MAPLSMKVRLPKRLPRPLHPHHHKEKEIGFDRHPVFGPAEEDEGSDDVLEEKVIEKGGAHFQTAASEESPRKENAINDGRAHQKKRSLPPMETKGGKEFPNKKITQEKGVFL